MNLYKKLLCCRAGTCKAFLVFVAISSPLCHASRQGPAIGETSALAVNAMPEVLKDVGIEEKLGAQLPLDVLVRNEKNEEVPLRSLIDGSLPILMSLAYYNCPSLCGLILNGMIDGLKELDWKAGDKFKIINLSISSRETAELARQKKATLLKATHHGEWQDHWAFLTASEGVIAQISEALGYKFKWDPIQKEFVHGSGIFVLTPEGRISRILYGIQYRPSDLKLSLLEASRGKIGTILDRILLFCYRYNPVQKGYSVAIQKVLQLGALLTILLLGGYISSFWIFRRLKGPTGEGS